MPAEPAPGQAPRHNHFTRDVRPQGECPACDLTHARQREPAPGQAAYEAYRLRLFDLAGVGEASQKPSRWDGMKPNEHGSWAAAEAAVAAPLNAELGRLREEAASLRGQLAAAPEVWRGPCTSHAAEEHVQLRTNGHWMCVIGLRGLDDGWRELEALTSERDAHKLRADHYEGRWRAEHGLPAEEGAPPVTPLDTALQHVREARQFLGERNRYRKALELIGRPVDRPDGIYRDYLHDPATVPHGVSGDEAELRHRIALARKALEGGGEPGRYDAEGKWHPASQPWPGGVSDLDDPAALVARVREVIARYRDDELSAAGAFDDIFRAMEGSPRVPDEGEYPGAEEIAEFARDAGELGGGHG